MKFAIGCFIFFLLGCIFFICAGYWAYKRNNDINEMWAGLWFSVINLIGCLISGIRIFVL